MSHGDEQQALEKTQGFVFPTCHQDWINMKRPLAELYQGWHLRTYEIRKANFLPKAKYLYSRGSLAPHDVFKSMYCLLDPCNNLGNQHSLGHVADSKPGISRYALFRVPTYELLEPESWIPHKRKLIERWVSWLKRDRKNDKSNLCPKH